MFYYCLCGGLLLGGIWILVYLLTGGSADPPRRHDPVRMLFRVFGRRITRMSRPGDAFHEFRRRHLHGRIENIRTLKPDPRALYRPGSPIRFDARIEWKRAK